jgi:hypothetical protein
MSLDKETARFWSGKRSWRHEPSIDHQSLYDRNDLPRRRPRWNGTRNFERQNTAM